MENYIRISVRGTEYVTSSPGARDLMEKLSKDGHVMVSPNGDYFIDRSPVLFHKVLDYLSGRKFHLPKGICAIEAREELEFWMIPIEAVPNCCYEVLYDDKLSSYDAIEKAEEQLIQGVFPHEENNTPKTKLRRFRDILNKAVLDPFSCLLGKIWLLILAVLTLTAVVCFVLNSVEEYRIDRDTLPVIPNNKTYNFLYSNPKRKMLLTKIKPPERTIIEGFCNTVLLLDLILRFIISHRKKAFFLNIRNIIELITGIMCFLIIYIDSRPGLLIDYPDLGFLILVIGALYSLRVLKLLRLAESTAEMKILKLCFYQSWKILCFLVMVFTIFSVIFGCGMFWAEFNNPDTFLNIPISIWWAIVTITTVGYGDVYPKSTFGYLMASVTAMIGISLIAIPVATLSSNFNTFYTCYTYRKKYVQAKKKAKEVKSKDLSEPSNIKRGSQFFLPRINASNAQ